MDVAHLRQSPAGLLLQRTLATGRPAHAYLFTGPVGLGQRSLAQDAAMALLCEHAQVGTATACMACRTCRNVASGNHPDVRVLEPDGASLKLEQIHQLRADLSLRPLEGERRCFIIEADTMTLPAANSLLKILEEPPPHVHLILIASDASALPSTIVSRCQMIPFRPWPLVMVQDWLLANVDDITLAQATVAARVARGLPERAQQLLTDEALPELQNVVFAALTAVWKGDVLALLQQTQIWAAYDRPTLQLSFDLLALAIRDRWLLMHNAPSDTLVFSDQQGWLAQHLPSGSSQPTFDLESAIQRVAEARARLHAYVQVQPLLDDCLLSLLAIYRNSDAVTAVARPQ